MQLQIHTQRTTREHTYWQSRAKQEATSSGHKQRSNVDSHTFHPNNTLASPSTSSSLCPCTSLLDDISLPNSIADRDEFSHPFYFGAWVSFSCNYYHPNPYTRPPLFFSFTRERVYAASNSSRSSLPQEIRVLHPMLDRKRCLYFCGRKYYFSEPGTDWQGVKEGPVPIISTWWRQIDRSANISFYTDEGFTFMAMQEETKHRVLLETVFVPVGCESRFARVSDQLQIILSFSYCQFFHAVCASNYLLHFTPVARGLRIIQQLNSDIDPRYPTILYLMIPRRNYRKLILF